MVIKEKERLIIFGISGSGKSTLLRQMRLHFGDGLPPNERRRYTPHIRQNVLECLRKLAQAMVQLGLDFDTDEGRQAAQTFEDLDSLKSTGSDEDVEIPKDVLEAGLLMWADAGVKAASARGNEFHLMDNAVYFLNALGRIAQDTYVPTLEDVLRMRYRTSGAVYKDFELPSMSLNVIDLGGQRQERAKWFRHVDKPSLVLFVASLAEFDRTLVEDEDKNSLVESIEVFQNIYSNPLFNNIPIMIFFNKLDVFRSKLEKQSFAQHFPEFRGQSEEDAMEFIKKMYKKVVPRGKLGFSCRFTCAVDVANTKAVLSWLTANISKGRILATGLT
ncbi:guanine nucleotide-binding protein G(q) subunit alpha-like isoform X2 [Oratosquilla oratoria]